MALVGYARVSTRDQNPEAQTDALAAAGCGPEHIYVDKASGVLRRRPALTQAFTYLRPGDTLVVTKLDRLGRSVKNLKEIADDLQTRDVSLRVLAMGLDTATPAGRLFFHLLAAFAEFEHDLIVERTHDGLEAARARGRKGGRPPALTPDQLTVARELHADGKHTVTAIARIVGTSRATLYRHLQPATDHAAATDASDGGVA